MHKVLATLALAAAPALLFSACNGAAGGSSGYAPLPNGSTSAHRLHPHDNGPQDLHAGGATFPAYAYNLANQPVGSYDIRKHRPESAPCSTPRRRPERFTTVSPAAAPDARPSRVPRDQSAPPTGPCAPLGATPTGFGGRQDPLDFVGSDVAMPSTEYPSYQQVREPATGTNWGEPFEFPTIGGPIVYGYRAKDFSIKNVRFSTWTYCAITNGTVSRLERSCDYRRQRRLGDRWRLRTDHLLLPLGQQRYQLPLHQPPRTRRATPFGKHPTTSHRIKARGTCRVAVRRKQGVAGTGFLRRTERALHRRKR